MLEFRILGPLEVVERDQPVVLGVPKQRALLAVLLLYRNQVVSNDQLVDALWGEHPPPSAATTVRVYVSNLRKALGGNVLLTRAGGYVVSLGRARWTPTASRPSPPTPGSRSGSAILPRTRAVGDGARPLARGAAGRPVL